MLKDISPMEKLARQESAGESSATLSATHDAPAFWIG